ncbi:30S ribosomal protein S6--L-glutamate ligase [Parendozoicomonas haliclonae]|uniref:Probable alpha-L-glutamate ligase n=1 Tax=Parendozoicomonas haliclonae TaxID=1960125 RepID=A0A1X7AP03_9GAMM|nr:30S ribosomal protein S6--L-glutamate ligase [Parendozoicomonas haliclonae]SMA49820.1 Ribosomal protein S6 modification protein [Parendozoicomonas haliclonae]
MRIGILSREPECYSTRRLVEAGIARGHQIDVIDTVHCYMDITSSKPTVRYDGEALPKYDAIIPRIGANITFYGTSVVRQFEMMGTFAVNSSVAISQSRDKLWSLQLMSRKGVGMPRTGFANEPDDIKDLIKNVGGAPVVIKLLEGTQGIGVVLAETNKAAVSMIEAFMGIKANILVQEFIAEAGGADIRCLVVDGKVIAAMKRQGAEGEFRSNLHRGGSAELVKLTKEERATAVNAAKIMGLSVCGVDILRSNRGPLVMEVNSSPGLEGIESSTGKDVAGMIYEFIEKKASKKATRRIAQSESE